MPLFAKVLTFFKISMILFVFINIKWFEFINMYRFYEHIFSAMHYTILRGQMNLAIYCNKQSKPFAAASIRKNFKIDISYLKYIEESVIK